MSLNHWRTAPNLHTSKMKVRSRKYFIYSWPGNIQTDPWPEMPSLQICWHSASKKSQSGITPNNACSNSKERKGWLTAWSLHLTHCLAYGSLPSWSLSHSQQQNASAVTPLKTPPNKAWLSKHQHSLAVVVYFASIDSFCCVQVRLDRLICHLLAVDVISESHPDYLQ